MLLDTQVISYAFKGQTTHPVAGGCIPSIVANEFLDIYTSDLHTARYYVPLRADLFEKPGHLGHDVQKMRDHFHSNAFPKTWTDRLVMHFGPDFPSITEYGSAAVAKIINQRASRTFRLSISTLEVNLRRAINHRFQFLMDNHLTCIPLVTHAAKAAQRLLLEFTRSHSLKANFRNSMNDLLILAIALRASIPLLTRDSVLARFAARERIVRSEPLGEWTRLDTSRVAAATRHRSRESKGYVNRGWEIRALRSVALTMNHVGQRSATARTGVQT